MGSRKAVKEEAESGRVGGAKARALYGSWTPLPSSYSEMLDKRAMMSVMMMMMMSGPMMDDNDIEVIIRLVSIDSEQPAVTNRRNLGSHYKSSPVN